MTPVAITPIPLVIAETTYEQLVHSAGARWEISRRTPGFDPGKAVHHLRSICGEFGVGEHIGQKLAIDRVGHKLPDFVYRPLRYGGQKEVALEVSTTVYPDWIINDVTQQRCLESNEKYAGGVLLVCVKTEGIPLLDKNGRPVVTARPPLRSVTIHGYLPADWLQSLPPDRRFGGYRITPGDLFSAQELPR